MDKLDKYLTERKDFIGVDEVGNFWVVTKPTGDSQVIDILFEADIPRMALQFLGGLLPHQISGIYKSRAKAKKHAEKLIGK